jgi:predicted glycogen debranching enzyme
MATTAAIPSIMGMMTDDPSSLLAKEWLITNGIGGYASSSLLGIATRRYHGVFVPDLPGRGRTLLIPRLDETVEWATQTVLLSGAEYADGRIEHDGVLYLKDIRREWQTPVWRFNLGGSVLEKRIVAPHGQNTVYVQYRCLNGSLRLHLRPYVTYRMHDAKLGEGQAEASAARRPKSQARCAAPERRLCGR